MDGLILYLREVEKIRLLSHGEEKELLERIQAGDRRALHALIAANLKWVVAVSAEFRDRGIPMSDLIAEGNLRLIRAASNFDPSRGLRFTGFAIWRIRQGLEKAIPLYAQPLDAPAGLAPQSLNRLDTWVARLSPEIRRAIGALAEPGRTVLKLFFGLDTSKPMTLESISRMLGVDLDRAVQLKDRALRELKETLPDYRRNGYRGASPAFHP